MGVRQVFKLRFHRISEFHIPNSQFSILHSQFSIPHSEFPTPNSQLILKPNFPVNKMQQPRRADQ